MIFTIRVDDVLRDALPMPSRHLVTRPTGAAVRARIQERLVAESAPTAQLDFSEVDLIDFSCADEVIAKLLLAMGGDRYVVLANLDETQAEAIGDVLERQDLAVAAVPRGGRPCLLGRTTPDLVLAFEAVQSGGPGDTARLAARLEWSLERAADALQTLALRRLVVAAAGTFSPLPYR